MVALPQIIPPSVLLVTLLAQALLPDLRLLIVMTGAALCCLATSLTGVATTGALLADVPWGVLIILVGLGLLAELLAAGRVFGPLAVRAAVASGGRPHRLRLAFAVGMYAVSGLVNNITALVLVLPVLLVLLRTGDARPRTVHWTVGTLLVACNLGGAATPIGDFPAILLLSRGSMRFTDYLVRALPATLAALALLLGCVGLLARPERGAVDDPLARGLSLAVTTALHRRVRPARGTVIPAVLGLGAMLLAWTFLPDRLHVGPELVCWLGVCVVLLARGRQGERLARTRVDVEAVLFLLGLFVMVAAVRRAGVFDALGAWILELPLPPRGRLVVFLALAGVLTGLFSAGPGMAALLNVGEALTRELPGPSVYVGLALSVCAGSSLFLTAATSGPLAQALVERADLRDGEGRPVRFGFLQFLPVGLLSFAVIEGVAIAYGLLTTR